MNVKFFASEMIACGWVRGVVPARALNTRSMCVRVDVKLDMLPSDWPGTDLMVFQRKSDGEWLRYLEEAKRRGIPVLYEIDDDVWNIPAAFEKPHDFYKREDIRGPLMRIAAGCDAISVSTAELARVVQGLFPEQRIIIVENAVDLEMWNDAERHRRARLAGRETREGLPDDAVVIGWHASQSHVLDCPVVMDALPRVLAENPKALLHFVGWVGFKEIPALARFKDRVRSEGWAPMWDLPRYLAGWDIGLAPLMPNAWNISKSAIKWMEYGAVGLPCLASPAPCYERVVQHGRNGLLAADNNPESWYSLLTELVRVGPEERARMGFSAWSDVLYKHDINRTWPAWEKVLRDVAGGGAKKKLDIPALVGVEQ